MVSTLVQNAKYVGLIPTLGAIFPIFITSTTLVLRPGSYTSYILYSCLTCPVCTCNLYHRLYVCNCKYSELTIPRGRGKEPHRPVGVGDIRKPRWCNAWHTSLDCKGCHFDSCSRRNISHFHRRSCISYVPYGCLTCPVCIDVTYNVTVYMYILLQPFRDLQF